MISLRVEWLTLGGVAGGLVGLPGVAVLHAVVEFPTVVTLLLGVGGIPAGVVPGLGILALALLAIVALVAVAGRPGQVLLHQVEEELFDPGGGCTVLFFHHVDFGLSTCWLSHRASFILDSPPGLAS